MNYVDAFGARSLDKLKQFVETGVVVMPFLPGDSLLFVVGAMCGAGLMSLPLTLAILDGMIVRIGSENYIIPITSIIETICVRPSEVRHVEGRGDVMNVRRMITPVFVGFALTSVNARAGTASEKKRLQIGRAHV